MDKTKQPQPDEVLDDLKAAGDASKNWLVGLVELFNLDVQLATTSLVRIAIYCIFVAILGLTTTFLAVFAAGYFLYLQGASIALVILFSICVLLLLIVFSMMRIKSLGKNLLLRETRKQIKANGNLSTSGEQRVSP